MPDRKSNFWRFIPLTVIAVGLILFFYFGLYRYLSFESLAHHREILLNWTQTHYFWMVLGFMLFYTFAIALSVPGGVFITLLGGFLFGPFWGTLYVVISASIGASLIFLAVKFAFNDWFGSKAGSWVAKLEAGFQKNAFSYLLSIRLIPIFPFWVINIVPALLNMKLSKFFLATFLGIIPGTAVYASLGNGLSTLFSIGKTPDLSVIFKPAIFVPLLLLAALSLLPILYRRFKKTG